jgi:hypothetical protein
MVLIKKTTPSDSNWADSDQAARCARGVDVPALVFFALSLSRLEQPPDGF